MFSCLRKRAVPWHYYQLNGHYFNTSKGIFSKLDIDEYIPEKHRLRQTLFDPSVLPDSYPVFLKPEWGQNSNGIARIDNRDQFLIFAEKSGDLRIPYIVQEAAPTKKEYEIYYLRSPEKNQNYSYLSVTETVNLSGEAYPINTIHNSSTLYSEITPMFAREDLAQIWHLFGEIGNFRMSRVGVKAKNPEALVRGEFKIIEINLFLPMPLVLLADNVSRKRKHHIINKTMQIAAELVKTIPREEKKRWIFFRKMVAHYKVIL